jgi:surface antigen
MSDARDNGKGVLAIRPEPPALGGGYGSARPAGLGYRSRLTRLIRRSLGAWQVPAAMAIAAALPTMVGVQNSSVRPSVVVCAGYSACAARGHTDHGYGAHAGASFWRMTAGDECTNYVAYVESRVFRAPEPRYLLGDAGQWPATAAAHGVVVNHVPSVGAVAEWDAGAPGMGSAGHVAVVEKVGPRDRYIVVSQQHIGADPDGYDWTRINAGFPSYEWQEWPDHFIHFAVRATAAVGYYNPRTGSWRLQASLGQSAPAITFRRREPGTIPLVGDWTGSGADGTGFYNPRTGWFRLRDTPGGGRPDRAFRFGPPGMVPLAGNWDGHGGDGIGYYDPGTGTFHLRDHLSRGPADHMFRFGPPGMVPLAGDWTGSGRTGIGYYDPKTGRFYLRNHLWAGPASVSFRFGPRGMVPLAGNWTGGRADEIGVYNPRDGWFHLRDHLRAGPANVSFRFGPGGMVPLAGDWAGA